ncbi:thiopeptide-type bacteriocin biosynthesis protein [Kitasatospora sp. NPDC051984]|uniref:thiopeptide-type bacteriocin biosynthesis protein n=1 Tax=Kitasatospora sp. NPDC051984 TaxID=3364059 RepID=UPI0037C8B8DF
MPAHQLTPRDPVQVESAVLRVLADTQIEDAANSACLDPTELATAVDLYRQAGRDALHQQTDRTCWQAYIEFADWTAAESVIARHLAPTLRSTEPHGVTWWFIRKYPCWRLRLHHDPSRGNPGAEIADLLDELTASGKVKRWWRGLYEPETAAFGGVQAMNTAHTLFYADSGFILQNPIGRHQELGRRELSMLLCTSMFHAAGLEWYEMGDVWQKVARERPIPSNLPDHRLEQIADQIRPLLLADTAPEGPLFHNNGPAAYAAAWADAFRAAGTALGTGSRAGELERGLRQVLAYHVIFHWNRLGLSADFQAALSHAAARAVLAETTESTTATALHR